MKSTLESSIMCAPKLAHIMILNENKNKTNIHVSAIVFMAPSSSIGPMTRKFIAISIKTVINSELLQNRSDRSILRWTKNRTKKKTQTKLGHHQQAHHLWFIAIIDYMEIM